MVRFLVRSTSELLASGDGGVELDADGAREALASVYAGSWDLLLGAKRIRYTDGMVVQAGLGRLPSWGLQHQRICSDEIETMGEVIRGHQRACYDLCLCVILRPCRIEIASFQTILHLVSPLAFSTSDSSHNDDAMFLSRILSQ